MACKKLGPVLLFGLLRETSAGALPAADSLVFNTTPAENNLERTFAAEVLFAQSQIEPARPREGDRQPHLVGRRRCLVLVPPLIRGRFANDPSAQRESFQTVPVSRLIVSQ